MIRSHDITFSHVYAGQQLPGDARNTDLLVVVWDPQDPPVTSDECALSDSRAEHVRIASAVRLDKSVIGVCLSAQLIGEALGASFAHSPEKEIGKLPVFMTAESERNPLFSHFGNKLDVGHWHSDMPRLPPGRRSLPTAKAAHDSLLLILRVSTGFSAIWHLHGLLLNC